LSAEFNAHYSLQSRAKNQPLSLNNDKVVMNCAILPKTKLDLGGLRPECMMYGRRVDSSTPGTALTLTLAVSVAVQLHMCEGVSSAPTCSSSFASVCSACALLAASWPACTTPTDTCYARDRFPSHLTEQTQSLSLSNSICVKVFQARPPALRASRRYARPALCWRRAGLPVPHPPTRVTLATQISITSH
jgi:hypothetical protein